MLTRAHFGHVGMAARMPRDSGTPWWIHPQDTHIAEFPYRYAQEKARWAYPLKYPRAIPTLARMAFAGAMIVKGVTGFLALASGPAPSLPGSSTVIHVPGHTKGYCALHFVDRNTVIAGDALVTLDPYTAKTGPRIVAAAATADTAEAFRSLSLLADTGAHTILPGHGDPHQGNIAVAVAHARSLPLL